MKSWSVTMNIGSKLQELDLATRNGISESQIAMSRNYCISHRKVQRLLLLGFPCRAFISLCRNNADESCVVIHLTPCL